MTRFARPLALILALIALAVGLLVVHDWAYVTTYRLYVSQRVDNAQRSAAAQRFDIENARVIPQIVSRDDDLVAFKVSVGQASTLQVGVRPVARASAERPCRPSHAHVPVRADHGGGR